MISDQVWEDLQRTKYDKICLAEGIAKEIDKFLRKN